MMTEKDYNRILASLMQDEQQRLFDILRKYNWILNKLENREMLRQVEEDFLDFRPHKVNDQLSIDMVERRIVYIGLTDDR